MIGHTPAQAASGQAEFVCSESAATILRGSTTPVYQTRAEAVMVFDFDRKLVLHGEGSERYPIRKVEAREIAALRLPRDHAVPDRWRRPIYSPVGALTHRAYTCQLASYLRIDIEP